MRMRFIPACAGNAALHIVCVLPLAVHPRMRGERVVAAADDPVAPWFIPACAGNAASFGNQDPNRAVHPRMRGERRSRAASVST